MKLAGEPRPLRLLGNGDASFRLASPLAIMGDVALSYSLTTPGFSPVNLALGDVNGDGNLDVVAATYQDIGGFEGREIGNRAAYLLPGDGEGALSIGPSVGIVIGQARMTTAQIRAEVSIRSS